MRDLFAGVSLIGASGKGVRVSRRLPLGEGETSRTACARALLRTAVDEKSGDVLTTAVLTERVGWAAALVSGTAAELLAGRWSAADVNTLASGVDSEGRKLPPNAWMALRRLGWGAAPPEGVTVNDRIVRMAQEQTGRILRSANTSPGETSSGGSAASRAPSRAASVRPPLEGVPRRRGRPQPGKASDRDHRTGSRDWDHDLDDLFTTFGHHFGRVEPRPGSGWRGRRVRPDASCSCRPQRRAVRAPEGCVDVWYEAVVSMTQGVEVHQRAARKSDFDLDTWIRPLCALMVAGVAAYASYVHQREFVLQGGADRVGASLWPLSVDGLLLLATAGLLKPSGVRTPRARGAVWSAFLLGIAVSLAANSAAAPALEWTRLRRGRRRQRHRHTWMNGGVAGLSYALTRAMRFAGHGPAGLPHPACGGMPGGTARDGRTRHVHPGSTLVTHVGRDVRWWTWAGYRANATLAATLQSVTDPLQRPTDSWLRLRENLTLSDWRTAREDIAENLVLPDVDHRAVHGLKFSAALPERLAVATVAARLADFESARAVLGEPVRFQYDS